jgi:hypothetical protein
MSDPICSECGPWPHFSSACLVGPVMRLCLAQPYPVGPATRDRPATPHGPPLRAGMSCAGYDSLWLPRAMLEAKRQGELADALFIASRRRSVEMHFQRGLAGGSARAVAATRDTAMNPKVMDASVLMIIGGEGPPPYPAVHGHEPDFAAARKAAGKVADAIKEFRNSRRTEVPTSPRGISSSPDGRRPIGAELPKAARSEAKIRSRRPILCPPEGG